MVCALPVGCRRADTDLSGEDTVDEEQLVTVDLKQRRKKLVRRTGEQLTVNEAVQLLRGTASTMPSGVSTCGGRPNR